jgi:hypothetical protein
MFTHGNFVASSLMIGRKREKKMRDTVYSKRLKEACTHAMYYLRLLPAPYADIEAANDVLLFFREVTMLNVWPQIVEPSQPAAFPASLQPCNKSFINDFR